MKKTAALPVCIIIIIGFCLGLTSCDSLFGPDLKDANWECESATYRKTEKQLTLIFNRTEILDKYSGYEKETFTADRAGKIPLDFADIISISNPGITVTYHSYERANDARYYIYYDMSFPEGADLTNTWVSFNKSSPFYMTAKGKGIFSGDAFLRISILTDSRKMRIY